MAELPAVYVLPAVQIRSVDPQVVAVVEANDTSRVEPLLIRVLGQWLGQSRLEGISRPSFFKHMARSDQRRCRLQWDFPGLEETSRRLRYVGLLNKI